jgi:hypothetical protein
MLTLSTFVASINFKLAGKRNGLKICLAQILSISSVYKDCSHRHKNTQNNKPRFRNKLFPSSAATTKLKTQIDLKYQKHISIIHARETTQKQTSKNKLRIRKS